MNTERKIFWAFLWLALALIGARLVADRVHIVVLHLEMPTTTSPRPAKPASDPRPSFTCRSVPPTMGAALVVLRESNTADGNPAHAADLQGIFHRA